jgi:hypothetical protein
MQYQSAPPATSAEFLAVCLRRHLLRTLMMVAIIMAVLVASGDTPTNELQIKAAFLCKFTKFIEWPNQEKSNQEIVIGVTGSDTFAALIRRLANDKAVSVRSVTRAEEARGVHVLFCRSGTERRLSAVLPALHAAGILTVGETPEFGGLGGIITFEIQDGKVRFSINRRAATDAGLKISPHLLKLAIEH